MKDRNQAMVALVGTALVAALVLLSANLGRLPFVHPTSTYHAEFANADGLKSGDDVRVQGITVGEVTRVAVDGDRVRADFTVKRGLALGAASSASIEVATVLGSLFLQIESSGPGTLRPGGTIPLARTTVPFTLVEALGEFGSFSGRTDLPTLQRSLRELAATVEGIAPDDAKAALRGLSRVSRTIADKREEISRVLAAADTVATTLNRNSAALVGLLDDGDRFLRLLQQRQAVIAQLLKDTAALGAEVSELIRRNGAQLSGLLDNLTTVTATLSSQGAALRRAITVLGQFSVNFSNATGSGPWLDLLTPLVVTPDNVVVACGPEPRSVSGPCGK